MCVGGWESMWVGGWVHVCVMHVCGCVGVCVCDACVYVCVCVYVRVCVNVKGRTKCIPGFNLGV